MIAGSSTDPNYIKKIEQLIATHNLASCVTLLINAPRAKILDMLSEASVFVLHSREESQGIALCEALAVGIPVVATNIGGIPYVVTNETDGFLVPYGDVQAFASAITKILGDRQLRATMSAKAHQNSQRFNWNTISENVMAIYRLIIQI